MPPFASNASSDVGFIFEPEFPWGLLDEYADEIGDTNGTWYDELVVVFQAYVNPLIGIIGMLSNLLSIYVFARYLKQQKTTTSTVQYLTVLSLVDFWNCLHFGLVGWLRHGLRIATDGRVSVNFQGHSTLACKIWRTSIKVRYRYELGKLQ